MSLRWQLCKSRPDIQRDFLDEIILIFTVAPLQRSSAYLIPLPLNRTKATSSIAPLTSPSGLPSKSVLASRLVALRVSGLSSKLSTSQLDQDRSPLETLGVKVRAEDLEEPMAGKHRLEDSR